MLLSSKLVLFALFYSCPSVDRDTDKNIKNSQGKKATGNTPCSELSEFDTICPIDIDPSQ